MCSLETQFKFLKIFGKCMGFLKKLPQLSRKFMSPSNTEKS